MFSIPIKSPEQPIRNNLLSDKGIHLFIKREDHIHPTVSGNKWRKLKYNLKEAKKLGKTTLLTFGGAYSNHILAVAAAGKINGFKTIGLIRGEEHLNLNPTLSKAGKTYGMRLIYWSRDLYKRKDEFHVKKQLKDEYGDFYLIPEGGTNDLAIKGCEEIVNDIYSPYDVITTSCGTGGTITGLICGLKGTGKILGFSALKGNFLKDEVMRLVRGYSGNVYNNWTIDDHFHFGGYAKFNRELIDFINEFKLKFQIPLDPVYTGKMMYGIFSLVKNDFFDKGTRIMALHTGGLQGIEGFNQRFGDQIK